MILSGKRNPFHGKPFGWRIRRWRIGLSAMTTESAGYTLRSSNSTCGFATCCRILHETKNENIHATIGRELHPMSPPSCCSSSFFPLTDAATASPLHAAAKKKGKKWVSSAVTFRRAVHKLVAQQRVDDALQLVWGGIHPLVATSPSWSRFLPPFVSSPTTPCGASVVFDWSAFTSVLYLCDLCGRPQEGVDLLQVVRQLLLTHGLSSSSSSVPLGSSASFSGVSTDSSSVILPTEDWMKEERFLSLLLRLQCAVHNETEATHLVSFLLQTNLLRARTASTYVHFCLPSPPWTAHSVGTTTTPPTDAASFPLADRLHKAWALYQECRHRHIGLSLSDAIAVAKLWVWQTTALLSTHADEGGPDPSSSSSFSSSTDEKREGEGREVHQTSQRAEPHVEEAVGKEETPVTAVIADEGVPKKEDEEKKKMRKMDSSERRVVLSHMLEALQYLLEDLREQEIAVDEIFLTQVLLPASALWQGKTRDDDGSSAAACRSSRVPSRTTTAAVAAKDDADPHGSALSVRVFTPSSPTSHLSTSSPSPSPLLWCSRPMQVSCPHCHGALQKQPFTEEQREMLLQQLEESIFAHAAARSHGPSRSSCPTDPSRRKGGVAEGSRAPALSSPTAAPPSPSHPSKKPPLPPGFLHWKTLLRQEVAAWTAATTSSTTSASSSTLSSSRVPYDIFIDGANVGYYGVSKWAGVAAEQQKWLPDGRGRDAGGTPPRHPHNEAGKRKLPSVVRVQLDFPLIDQALQLVTRVYGFRRPLILLHARHCRAEYLTPENAAILKQWEAKRVVYASPFGSNDDAWWLYGALFLHPYAAAPPPPPVSSSSFPFSSPSSPEKEAERKAKPNEQESIRSSGVYVLTNDKCRDHHFQFLSPRCFRRWRDQFCIRFHCVRESGVTHLRLDWPPAYSFAPQKIEWKEANAGATSASTDTSGKRWSWHLPIAASRLSSSSSPITADKQDKEENVGLTTHSDALVEGKERKDEEWVCVTYHS